jgi:hypothetical protein
MFGSLNHDHWHYVALSDSESRGLRLQQWTSTAPRAGRGGGPGLELRQKLSESVDRNR